MVRFFIDRPVFAWVLAIVAMMAGAAALVAFGTEVQQVVDAGKLLLDHLRHGALHGLCRCAGIRDLYRMTITLYFEQGTNPDIAQVQVQNKLQLATPLLPAEVQAQGIRVAKATRNFLLVIGFYSADGSMNNDDISDYVASHVRDPISRTPGVGDYQLFGSQYAMRIWLDSARLDNYGLTTAFCSL